METMHAAGRRTLPPVPRAGGARVPRPAGDRAADDQAAVDEAATDRFSPVPDAPVGAGPSGPEPDAAQQFVTRLRSAGADFAAAAGAASAVVREAVPPARHRRARCRVALRYPDDTEADVTLLGPAGDPGSPSRHSFDRQIRRWLRTGQRRDGAWLVADPDSPDGVAVDVGAWLAAG
jgi:hypothetical protein